MSRQAGIDGSFWRAITVFRIASVCYAALLLLNAGGRTAIIRNARTQGVTGR
jgi:hypothetical protein